MSDLSDKVPTMTVHQKEQSLGKHLNKAATEKYRG